ncbi:kinase-like domain-containing protein [Rhizophagus clarus]|uniref:Kinase-like domain-containing protein n=1 Tax=Rhizophagus clarus TaxID=94130 RepID=A0A8H3ML35_9GLOM|nr:kinase-like domain-containing protein [Rhizophagus clarus]
MLGSKSFEAHGITENIENLCDFRISSKKQIRNNTGVGYLFRSLNGSCAPGSSLALSQIGAGSFGKVYRANWKTLENYLVLKSFFNLDIITMKEIVRELKIQHEVDFHNNILRYYGITKFESENNDNSINYMLVMEYADGGNLRNYLKNNFSKLTWNDKYFMAYQLACAVSYLHNKGIAHCDLHFGNILVHQNTIKIADFGSSKRIGISSNFQSKLFEMVPYVDPKTFDEQKSNNNQSTQTYSLNEKSDIYSVGVLLWEISSGRPPFYAEDEKFDVCLASKICQGLRESIVPDTPEKYVKIYTQCWDGEPCNRPTVYQVVDWLKEISMAKSITENPLLRNQELNEVPLRSINLEPQELVSLIIDNFNKINIKEIDPIVVSNEQEKLSFEKGLNIIIDHTNDLIFSMMNKGIATNENDEKAFKLFIKASETNHILAQYFVGDCYRFGYGTIKNEKLAFEYFEKVVNANFIHGQLRLGYLFENGIGVEKDSEKAIYWYEKAANNGNITAMYNLGLCYEEGHGVEEDYNKAFKLYKQSAEGGYSGGIIMLEHCFNNGIGTQIDKKKALELQKSTDLESMIVQYNLGNMYENGVGITKDIDKAIYWYEKSAKKGYQSAQNKLENFKKINNL